MKTLRVGLIGAGTHGTRYARHLKNDVPGMTLSAVCRRDETAGRALASQLDVPWCPTAHELLERPDVDAVVIATPPSSHHELTVATLGAKKPVLIEKPMAGDLDEALDLAARAEAHGAPVVMVAQTLRWNPVLRRVRELWPTLGPVHLIRLAQRLEPTELAWQRDPALTVGGSVLLTGVHLFDTVRWLSGREFVQVDSRQERVLNPVVEDLFLARCRLDDGCWADLEVSKYTRSRAGWIEVVGEHGQIHADYLTGGLVRRGDGREEREAVDARTPTLPGILAAWRDAIDGRAPTPVTATDGLRTLEIVDACYRSDALRAAVAL